MLLPFFEWCEATALGQLVRNSLWLFPVIEAMHLLALSVLGGALLVLDLRMLGAIAAMLMTGVLLFLSEAVKCYHNPSFWVKMTTLPIALLFTLTVRRRIALGTEHGTSVRTRLTAVASIALWFTVAAAGRWIGFSS